MTSSEVLPAPPIRLVVGLGNPGKQYVGTRHNIGFAVVEQLAERAGIAFKAESKWNAQIAQDRDLTLMKPLTFMNLSGEAAGEFARFYKLASESVLVVMDDVALPLGSLRLRKSGSPGGHNGLESVMVHLSTERVPRLRLGIGASSGQMTDHVLGKFSAEELPLVDDCIKRAADAIDFIRSNGIEAAMNKFNLIQKS